MFLQLCGERLLGAEGDPVSPERCGETDDSPVLRDRIQQAALRQGSHGSDLLHSLGSSTGEASS